MPNIAIRGLLVGIVVTCLTLSNQGIEPKRYGGDAQAAENKQNEKSHVTHFKSGMAVDHHTYRTICHNPKDKDHADLCQQWRVAEAADGQYWLNLLGLLLIGGTLVFTAMAARAARDAARHTKATADAAISSAASDREANEILRTNTALELRAYLSPEPGGINQLIKSDQTMGHVSIRNVGRLPARRVSVFVHMATFRGRQIVLAVENDVGIVDRVIQPGAVITQGSDQLLPLTEITQHTQGDHYVYVYGIVYYDDGYDKRRFTRFCHRYPTAGYNRRTDWNRDASESRSVIDADKARYHTAGNDAD